MYIGSSMLTLFVPLFSISCWYEAAKADFDVERRAREKDAEAVILFKKKN